MSFLLWILFGLVVYAALVIYNNLRNKRYGKTGTIEDIYRLFGKRR